MATESKCSRLRPGVVPCTAIVMKTKCLLPSFLLSVLLCSCGSKPQAVAPEGFRADIMLKTTPVKDCGKSPADWCCAMLAVIETEHLMQGDSVNLSFDYVMRCWLRQQTEGYVRSKGSSDIAAVGDAPTVTALLRRYGCFPYDSYYNQRPVNYNVLVRRVKMLADVAMARGDSKEKCMAAIDGLLDKEIGSLPKHVYMLRAEYTPLEFAHSVCGKDEYTAVYMDGNMDKDSVEALIRKSLEARHPVLWASSSSSVGTVAIIGMGRDTRGNGYFVAKGTRGDSDNHGDRLYLPTSLIRRTTDFIVIKREL